MLERKSDERSGRGKLWSIQNRNKCTTTTARLTKQHGRSLRAGMRFVIAFVCFHSQISINLRRNYCAGTVFRSSQHNQTRF